MNDATIPSDPDSVRTESEKLTRTQAPYRITVEALNADERVTIRERCANAKMLGVIVDWHNYTDWGRKCTVFEITFPEPTKKEET